MILIEGINCCKRPMDGGQLMYSRAHRGFAGQSATSAIMTQATTMSFLILQYDEV